MTRRRSEGSSPSSDADPMPSLEQLQCMHDFFDALFAGDLPAEMAEEARRMMWVAARTFGWVIGCECGEPVEDLVRTGLLWVQQRGFTPVDKRTGQTADLARLLRELPTLEARNTIARRRT